MKGFSPPILLAVSRNMTQPSGPLNICQIRLCSSGRLHEGIKHQHHFWADSISLLIHWTSVCAYIFVSNLLAAPTESFCLVSSQISCNLKLIFFIQPFLHVAFLSYQTILLPFLSIFRSLRRWRGMEVKVEVHFPVSSGFEYHIQSMAIITPIRPSPAKSLPVNARSTNATATIFLLSYNSR